ncbi:right-handed parallel beta-helix repeat-containing protein [Actinoplanes oblitus]|uniref:Right-handed parallel beta-helix repeat-containing protein n=1 Tax=Actinoplanes oblitus TaxID=3040509 RepID=A0ABY8WP04_9ACTN|nr:right-handed parallel beta-helix repeat-containing protein [Actinoplanes oblitus]WIM99606.1 right-handed parallel beta-helix repeat-containing protein [Actinoplanes oblitus]
MASHNTGSPGSRRHLITGAGLAAGVAIFGPSAPASAEEPATAEPALVVVKPSGKTTGADDSANIAAALALTSGLPGVEVHLAPGDFYINTPIVLGSNKRLFGAGAQATRINQVGTGHGIVLKPEGALNYVTVSGLSVVGNGSAGSCGIYFAPYSGVATRAEFGGLSNITIEDSVAKGWGDCGVVLVGAMASRITRVQATENGGNGFYVTFARWDGDSSVVSAATSLAFEACYARENGKNGYELDTVSYSTLNACAADCGRIGTRGYALFNCNAVTLTSCGAEEFVTEGFLFQVCTSCAVHGAYTWQGKSVGIHIGTRTTYQTIGGAVQHSPAAGTTNFIKSEAGTSAVVWGVSRPATTGASTNTFLGKVTNLDGSA